MEYMILNAGLNDRNRVCIFCSRQIDKNVPIVEIKKVIPRLRSVDTSHAGCYTEHLEKQIKNSGKFLKEYKLLVKSLNEDSNRLSSANSRADETEEVETV